MICVCGVVSARSSTTAHDRPLKVDLSRGLPLMSLASLAAILPATMTSLPRTAAIIGIEMACGDLVEQRVEKCERWDGWRSARLGLTGLITTGPLAHSLFINLEKMSPGTSIPAVMRKVVGNALFMPVMIAATLSTAWAFEGRSLIDIHRSLREELMPTVATGLLFWPAVNCFIFGCVSPPLRPVVSSGFGGAWGVMLSA